MNPDPRPRVEGEREQEILDATVAVLAEVGYDRLTMDAVATAARASKATLYRRWSSKPDLVVDAVCSRKPTAHLPDTGTLRGDLLAIHTRHGGIGGLGDPRALSVLGAVVTAMGRDPEFAETYRREFIRPRVAITRTVFERARERGEISPDADVELLAPAVPAIVLHRFFLLGETVTNQMVTDVVDHVVLPAAIHGGVLPPLS